MSKNLEINVRAKAYGMAEFSSYGEAIRKLGMEVAATSAKLKQIEAYQALKAELSSSEEIMKRTQREVLALGGAMSRAEQPTRQMQQEYARAVREAERAERVYFSNKERLSVLRGELQKTGINTGKLAAEQRQLTQAYEKSKFALEQNQKQVKAYGTLGMKSFSDINAQILAQKDAYNQLKASGKLSTLELVKAKQLLNANIKELRAETNGWAGALTKARGGLIALGGMAFVARDMAGAFTAYEQKMAEVNTLVNMSAERHAQLKKEVIGLSREYPQAATDLAAATYDIISAGVQLGNSTKVLELSAKAAVAGVTDTKTAVNLGVGAMNAYGLSVNDLSGIYDIMFATVKSGVTTFPELAQSMGGVMPIAKASGVSLADTAGAIAAMTKAGLKTPEASTALKGAITALSTPTAEAKKHFDDLGITWNGLIPTLEQLRQKNLSIDQMRQLIPDVQARTGVLSLLNSFDSLQATLSETNNAAGATQAAFNKMKDTPENQMKMFRNTIESLEIGLGNLLVQAILPVVQGMRWLIDSVMKSPTEIQYMVGGIVALTGAIALWNMGLGDIIGSMKLMVVNSYDAVAGMKTLELSTMTLKSGLTAAAGALGAFMAGWNVGKLISASDAFGLLDMSIGHYVQLYIAKIDKLFTTVMLKYAELKKYIFDLIPGFDSFAAKQQEIIDKYEKKLDVIDLTCQKIREEGTAAKKAGDVTAEAFDKGSSSAQDLAAAMNHAQNALESTTSDAHHTADAARTVGDESQIAAEKINLAAENAAGLKLEMDGAAYSAGNLAEEIRSANQAQKDLAKSEKDQQDTSERSSGQMIKNYLLIGKYYNAATASAESFKELESEVLRYANMLGQQNAIVRWQAQQTMEELRKLKEVWEGEDINKLNILDMDTVTYEAALEITKKLKNDENKTYATGGLIGGRRHSQGGTIIEAEAGEYIHPRSSVSFYGTDFMEAIRRRWLPKFADGGMVVGKNMPSIDVPDIPSRRFKTGSAVTSLPSKTVRVQFDMGGAGRVAGDFSEADANKLLDTLSRAKRVSCLEAI